MSFIANFREICREKNSLVCVGLDVVQGRIPQHLTHLNNPIYEFNKAIIEATSEYAAAYKLNTAFYEVNGMKGWEVFYDTIHYIPEGTLIICDAKRGDVGHSSEMYAQALLHKLPAHAITINPFLGSDSVAPFLSDPEKGAFVLCLTSNPGSADFQRLETAGRKLFEYVADKTNMWNGNDNCGLVVGATYPEEMLTIRKIAPSLPFLIPGVGAQGGDLEKSVLYGTDKKGELAIINSSRGIIFKSGARDFADAARAETKKLRDAINTARKK